MTEADLRKVIAFDAWTAGEQASLENGDVVVRSIETKEKQEIASIGVFRLKGAPPVLMQTFREAFSQKGTTSVRAGGRFRDEPAMEDVRNLDLEPGAVEQLRKCTVGNCDLNLSAEMIGRFQKEIDWSSADAGSHAAKLIREMLVEYASGYLTRGDPALGEYRNRRKAVDLTASHRALLADSTIIKQLSPEFADFLARFPAGSLAGIENSLHWAVVDLGLKPSITLSHSAAYVQLRGKEEQFFVSAKQIYASRYLDSSLSFTVLLRVESEGGIDSYVVFLDRSRSDVLDGPIGRAARGVTQREINARIKALLERAQLRLIAESKPTDRAVDEPSESEAWWFLGSTYSLSVLIAIGILVVIIALVLKRRSTR